jgi:hypothetical protein
MARRKWCRNDTIMTRADVKWFVTWDVQCPYFKLGANKEWHGMADGTIVYLFWHCPPNSLPELMCVEFDIKEGIEVLLRNLEKDRPSKVYYYGELPPELSKLPGLIPVARDP